MVAWPAIGCDRVAQASRVRNNFAFALIIHEVRPGFFLPVLITASQSRFYAPQCYFRSLSFSFLFFRRFPLLTFSLDGRHAFEPSALKLIQSTPLNVDAG